jgi:putative tryptophan/tyrosine transport system substrate-binding protein
MRRRDFLRVLCGAGALWPVRAGAQQTKMHRVAYVAYAIPVSEMIGANPINPFVSALLHGLRSLGYVEGQNLVMLRRNAEGRLDRVPEIMRELVSVNVDVIVTGTVPMVRAAKAVSQTIPIVMVGTGSPVDEGLIESFARPGGNVTGLAGISGNENAAKRLQVLKELLPGVSRVALLQSKAEMIAGWEQSMEAAARQLSIRLVS